MAPSGYNSYNSYSYSGPPRQQFDSRQNSGRSSPLGSNRQHSGRNTPMRNSRENSRDRQEPAAVLGSHQALQFRKGQGPQADYTAPFRNGD